MALVYLDIANPARSEDFHTERFLIDSGAIYSVLQRPVLDALGIQPHSRRTFTLANGDEIERDLGGALFRYKNHPGGRAGYLRRTRGQQSSRCGHPRSSGVRAGFLKRELRALPMLLAEQAVNGSKLGPSVSHVH